MRSDKEMEWKTLETKYLFKRNWLTAKVEKVELPDGRIYDEYYTLELSMLKSKYFDHYF